MKKLIGMLLILGVSLNVFGALTPTQKAQTYLCVASSRTEKGIIPMYLLNVADQMSTKSGNIEKIGMALKTALNTQTIFKNHFQPVCKDMVKNLCASGLCDKFAQMKDVSAMLSALMVKMSCPGNICSDLIPTFLKKVKDAKIAIVSDVAGTALSLVTDPTLKELVCITPLSNAMKKLPQMKITMVVNSSGVKVPSFVKDASKPFFDETLVNAVTCKLKSDELADELGLDDEDLDDLF